MLASWNIGSLTSRLVELVDVIVRRHVSILCVQETKWVNEKDKIIELGVINFSILVEIEIVMG